MQKLRIGILVSLMVSQSKEYMIGIYKNYSKLFGAYGRVFPVQPHQDPTDMKLDLLVLPGGPDVTVALQQEPDHGNFPIGTGKEMPTYSYFFKHRLQMFIDAGVPIFGICLGMQYLNVHFGGTLRHDMYGHQVGGSEANSQRVLVFPHKEILGVTVPVIRRVNSRHHQSIEESPKRSMLSPELIPLAVGVHSNSYLKSSEKNMSEGKLANKKYMEYLGNAYGRSNYFFGVSCVEAYYHKDKKIAGVQWHPEDLIYEDSSHGDTTTHSIVRWLLSGEPVEVPGNKVVPTGPQKYTKVKVPTVNA